MGKTMGMKLFGVVLACMVMSTMYAADDGAAATPGAGGNRQRGGGNFDPAQFQQRMLDRIKTDLGVSDDEWKALQPKVEAVMTAQRSTRTNNGFGGGRRGGAGGGGAAAATTPAADTANQTEVQKKSASLKELLAKSDADPKAIQEALKAFRDERDKAREALKKAQGDLKELLTAKQEAQLVLSGQLE